MLTKIGSIKASRVSVALVIAGILVALVGQLFVAKPAKADCATPDGRRFATGDKVGPYVCMPDGTWKAY